jgi:hypothetical protein
MTITTTGGDGDLHLQVSCYDAMTLKPVANGISNLTVSGSVIGSNPGTNTGDNPGVTSVTSSGSYGYSTGTQPSDCCFRDPYWYQLVSLEIQLIQIYNLLYL